MCSGTVGYAIICKNTTLKFKDWATQTKLKIGLEDRRSGHVGSNKVSVV